MHVVFEQILDIKFTLIVDQIFDLSLPHTSMLMEYLLHIRVKSDQINMNRPIDNQEADIIGHSNRQFDNTGISAYYMLHTPSNYP